MRVLGILFLFLNLVGSLIFWTAQPSTSLDIIELANQTDSNLSFQQSTFLELGEALPNSFVPERPVVRSSQYFFDSQFILDNFLGLSANCEIQGLNYKKLALTLNTNLPAFLIVFPHHNFT